MTLRKVPLCAFVIMVGITCSLRRRIVTYNPAYADSQEDTLAREVDDPTAILTQLQLIDLYTPRNFQSSAQTNVINLKPIVPLEPLSLIPFQQIIRPTFTVQQLATSSSSSTSTEFGDVQLFDLFVSNWPNSKETGFGWAIGPTFVFPTGRVSAAGTHAWEVGPAVAAKYLGVPHLMVGFLFQNPISFAYTNSSAKPQSQCEFQPFISYSLGDGWYVKSADSTWTVNWRHGTSTTLPISLGLGRVWKVSGLQLNTWTSGEWTTYRQNTNITPLYTFRFGVTLLFPDFYL
jgi:hypothetical protein